MVGVPGFEPETSSLSETRSNQLSYTPDTVGGLVELRGLEPLTLCLQSRCSSQLSYSPLVLTGYSTPGPNGSLSSEQCNVCG